jgi:hypothetical protein
MSDFLGVRQQHQLHILKICQIDGFAEKLSFHFAKLARNLFFRAVNMPPLLPLPTVLIDVGLGDAVSANAGCSGWVRPPLSLKSVHFEHEIGLICLNLIENSLYSGKQKP